MKCKHCDGTGTTNWCINGTFKECPYCGGTGEVDRFNAVDVLKVMEMVKKPHTNEEWIHTLNTEQLAEFLADKCNEVVETVLSDASCDICDIDNDDYWYRRADFVEWLKQPHTKE
jgi:RecJ-like exonuclease